MAKRIGLKDVAAAAKVSHMTVSRVVRGERTVKAATAEKVRRFIEKLGYRPDPALSALAAYRTRGRSRTAGSVLAFLETEKSAYNDLVLHGARDEAARLGYSVDSFPLPSPVAGQQQLNRLLFHRGIMGLLISPSSEPRRLEGWDWSHFAAVSMGALRHEPPCTRWRWIIFTDCKPPMPDCADSAIAGSGSCCRKTSRRGPAISGSAPIYRSGNRRSSRSFSAGRPGRSGAL